MGLVWWLFAIVSLIWVFNIDKGLQDLKLCVYFVCLCINACVYLCFLIKSSFVIDLFRLAETLITLKREETNVEIALSLSVCLFVSHKGRE